MARDGSGTPEVNPPPHSIRGREKCGLGARFCWGRCVVITLRAIILPKTNAGSLTVLRNELDAGHFQRALNRIEVVRHGNRSACLEISNSAFADLRFGS